MTCNVQLLIIYKAQVSSMTKYQSTQEHHTLLDWLSSYEPSHAHSRAVSSRLVGTCQWFLHNQKFVDWLNGVDERTILLAHGVPGSGKTILTSFVIDLIGESESDRTALAYMYFDHSQQAQLHATTVIASVLKQLCIRLSYIPQPVSALYRRHDVKGTRPSFKEMDAALQSLTDICFDTTYLVIDALDECEPSSIHEFLACLRNLSSRGHVKIFISCRSHMLATADPESKTIQIEVQASTIDLESYVSKVLEQGDPFHDIGSDFRARIAKTLVHNACKMYSLPQG